MKRGKVIVDTDVIRDHLTGGDHPSVLRGALQTYFCYTTVFNAIELFTLARNAREREAAEDALGAMKVLGLNARSAPRVGRLARHRNRRVPLALLIAGIAVESGLPILTGRPRLYNNVRGLQTISKSAIRV
jgi:predicted nucleic acid-binding protein